MQERIQCVAGFQSVRSIVFFQIQSGGEHGYGESVFLLRRHGCKLVLYGLVIGGFYGKLESHSVEWLRQFQAHLEIYRTWVVVIVYRGFHFFFRGNVECRILRLACEFYVAAFGQEECAERYYREGILHFAAVDCVSPG